MKPFYQKIEYIAKQLDMEINSFGSAIGIRRGELTIIKNGTQFTASEERAFWNKAQKRFKNVIEIPEDWRIVKEFDCRLLTVKQVPIFIRTGESESGLVFVENVDASNFPGPRWANIYRDYEGTCAGTTVNGKWRLRVGRRMWTIPKAKEFLNDFWNPSQCDRCGKYPIWDGDDLVHTSLMCLDEVRVSEGQRWKTIELWNITKRYFGRK